MIAEYEASLSETTRSRSRSADSNRGPQIEKSYGVVPRQLTPALVRLITGVAPGHSQRGLPTYKRLQFRWMFPPKLPRYRWAPDTPQILSELERLAFLAAKSKQPCHRRRSRRAASKLSKTDMADLAGKGCYQGQTRRNVVKIDCAPLHFSSGSRVRNCQVN